MSISCSRVCISPRPNFTVSKALLFVNMSKARSPSGCVGLIALDMLTKPPAAAMLLLHNTNALLQYTAGCHALDVTELMSQVRAVTSPPSCTVQFHHQDPVLCATCKFSCPEVCVCGLQAYSWATPVICGAIAFFLLGIEHIGCVPLPSSVEPSMRSPIRLICYEVLPR